jgi:surfactin synthase thioesterase subunit
MGSFLAAVVAVVGISLGAAFALETLQRTTDKSFATSSVRLSPGDGPTASGGPKGAGEKH